MKLGLYAGKLPLVLPSLGAYPRHECAPGFKPQGGLWETYIAAGAKAYQQGDYTEAEKQWVAAVKEAERSAPPDLPVGVSIMALERVYEAQGRYAEAEPLIKRALAIWEEALGPEHPHVATALENYAALLRKTGRDNEAAKLEARAKAIRARHAEQNPAN